MSTDLNHQQISFIKSGVRLVGYMFLLFTAPLAAFVLFAAEVIGIVEEIGE